MIEELAGIERQGGEAASDAKPTGKGARTSPTKRQGGRQKRGIKRKKDEEDELTETEKQRIQLQYLQWQSFVKDVGKRRTLAKQRREEYLRNLEVEKEEMKEEAKQELEEEAKDVKEEMKEEVKEEKMKEEVKEEKMKEEVKEEVDTVVDSSSEEASEASTVPGEPIQQ